MSLGRTAVVLGGSMAGLCAAGALAPHFDEVARPRAGRAAGRCRAPARRTAEQAPALPAQLGAAGDQRAVPRVRGGPDRGRRAAPDAVDGRGLPRAHRLGVAQAVVDDDGLQLADPDRAGAAGQGARAQQRRHPRGRLGARDRDGRRRHRPGAGHRRRLLDRSRRARSGSTPTWSSTRWAAVPRSPTGWSPPVGPRRRCRRSTPRSPTPRGGTTSRLPRTAPPLGGGSTWWSCRRRTRASTRPSTSSWSTSSPSRAAGRSPAWAPGASTCRVRPRTSWRRPSGSGLPCSPPRWPRASRSPRST